LQHHGNDVLPPPPLLIPSALAEFHARLGDLDRSKVASWIIKPSIANRHIFGGGGKGGGMEANKDEDGDHRDDHRGNDGGGEGSRLRRG
jgi:hypothetical protein